jgi:hypothetical protein
MMEKQSSTKTLLINQFTVQIVQSGAARKSANLVVTMAISAIDIPSARA